MSVSRWWKKKDTAASSALSLALQGGGAHGAYTWGVLDRLLEEGLALEGISGTSAGAMNAVALAHGFARAAAEFADPLEARQAGAALARATLTRLWEGVGMLGSLMWGVPLQNNPLLGLMSQWLKQDQLESRLQPVPQRSRLRALMLQRHLANGQAVVARCEPKLRAAVVTSML